MANAGIVTLDLHGKNQYQARMALDAALRKSRGVYRLRVIHGSHSGTALRDMVRTEYADRCLRLDCAAANHTDLILREF